MDYLLACPMCAGIYSGDYHNGECVECGVQLIKTDILEKDDPIVCTTEWYALRRKIYKEYIEPDGLMDFNSKRFKRFYNEYFGDGEEKSRRFDRIAILKKEIQDINDKKESTLPHCPVCNSTLLQKISLGNKVGSAALIGIFSLGHISKTFKCLKCGYKF